MCAHMTDTGTVVLRSHAGVVGLAGMRCGGANFHNSIAAGKWNATAVATVPALARDGGSGTTAQLCSELGRARVLADSKYRGATS
jgi:histidinol-phosphate/aromatic aminotransferase/cobyric acid decarboxylase-like protein